MYWRVTEKTVASRLPAALAYGLIRRVCSPANLVTERYLDVIHIAIVYGERDLLELRIGSISPLDLNDLIASVLYSRGNTTARSVLQLDRNRR